jgi:hypothetical protein
MFEISVKYEGVGDVVLTLNHSGEFGTSFVVKTKSEKEKNLSEWYERKADNCFYHNLDFDETLHYLPAISEWLGVDIEVEFNAFQTNGKEPYHSKREGSVTYYMYALSVNKRCLFRQNNMVHASLFDIRRNIVNYIARLVFNYDLIKSKE